MKVTEFYNIAPQSVRDNFYSIIRGDNWTFGVWCETVVANGGVLDHDGFILFSSIFEALFDSPQDYSDFLTAYTPAPSSAMLTPLLVSGTPYGDAIADMSTGGGLLTTDQLVVSRPVGGVYTDYRISGSDVLNVVNRPWIEKTAAFNAVPYAKYICDTSGGAFTATLPANPDLGIEIEMVTVGSLLTNNLTVARNGSTINGAATNLVLNLLQPTKFHFVCTGTNEWRYY